MKILSAITLSLLTSLSGMANAESWDLKGEAFDLETGDLLYTEEHYLSRDSDAPTERRVDYIRPDGERFARKVLRFDTGLPYVPSLDWEDLETETEITGRLDGDRFIHQIRGPDRDEEEEANLSDPESVVYDAAFDRFLVERFETLIEEGQLRFDFLSLSAGRTYSFRARVTDTSDDEVVVEVGPASAVLRFFVDPIELTYDRSEQRLTRFTGVTNFRRDGSLLSADIQYQYPE